ncbi:MAG: YdcF family protein [Clostridia bacterium]|nr:YdcF family protein [Clostridia bacterium]
MKMKRIVSFILLFCLCLSLVLAEEETEDDPAWTIAENTQIPEDVRQLFAQAVAAEDIGSVYTPVSLLGEGNGVYCILCLSHYEDPDIQPWYTLVYIGENGVQNTKDLWIDEYAEPDLPAEEEEEPITYGKLVSDLYSAWEARTNIQTDLEVLNDDVSAAITDRWTELFMENGFSAHLNGDFDPAELPVSGRHAFVVLGLELVDGEMQEELKGRCEAAAAAAGAFPDSILICSGGATGENNPDAHTEAGLMKAYLSDECGIDPDRIFVDERALTTAGNAVNTFVIMREQGIETFTIITSSYHQRRAQMVYSTMGLITGKMLGYSAEIAGDYCFGIEEPEETKGFEAIFTAMQMQALLSILDSPEEDTLTLLTEGGAY